MFIGAKDSILLIYADFVIRFTAALYGMFQSTEFEIGNSYLKILRWVIKLEGFDVCIFTFQFHSIKRFLF